MSRISSASIGQSASGEVVRHVLRELSHWWNRHELERVVALHAADYEGTDVGCNALQHGPGEVGECFARYWRAFPDLRVVVTECVVEGNRVAASWCARGTHAGNFMNIPATSRRVTLRGVCLLTLDGDRISRGLYVWDVAAFLRAVRLLPDL